MGGRKHLFLKMHLNNGACFWLNLILKVILRSPHAGRQRSWNLSPSNAETLQNFLEIDRPFNFPVNFVNNPQRKTSKNVPSFFRMVFTMSRHKKWTINPMFWKVTNKVGKSAHQFRLWEDGIEMGRMDGGTIEATYWVPSRTLFCWV